MTEPSNPVPEREPAPPRLAHGPRLPRFPWITAIVALVVIVLASFALVVVLKAGKAATDMADKGGVLIEKGIKAVPEIARNFKTGKITQTFRESIPEIKSTGGDILELAISRSEESFTRTHERRIAWDWVYLGTTIAEIRVPVTFRYHLRLSEQWRLATHGQVCIVLAPPIRPSLPPAIHTEGMEKRAESGWARFDKLDQLEKLQAELTGLLEKRAMDPAHTALVREECRKSVAAFVKTWLLREAHWRSDRFTAIVVVFPDEVTVSSDEALGDLQAQPILKLEAN